MTFRGSSTVEAIPSFVFKGSARHKLRQHLLSSVRIISFSESKHWRLQQSDLGLRCIKRYYTKTKCVAKK